MTDDAFTHITNLPREELRPIASAVLDADAIPTGPLSVTAFGRVAGPGTVGIFRVSGEAKTAMGERIWSVVVKVLDTRGGSDHTWATPQRELTIYRSGVFAELPGGFRSARCYAIWPQNGLYFVWLEDLTEAPQSPWLPEHLIEAARHLGHFNANWSEKTLPKWEWLNQGVLHEKYQIPNNAEAVERLSLLQNHDLVRRAIPPELFRRVIQLWSKGSEIFAKVATAPKGICHLDFHPKNAFPRVNSAQGTYTVGVDWSTAGIDSLGSDLGSLLIAPIKWLEMEPAEAEVLVEPVFDAYLSGLAEAGWSGNEEQVRLTYLACLGGEAYRVNGMVTRVVVDPGRRAWIEEILMTPVEEMFDRWGEAQPFYLAYSEEALELARRL
jgi:hypothetical protein